MSRGWLTIKVLLMASGIVFQYRSSLIYQMGAVVINRSRFPIFLYIPSGELGLDEGEDVRDCIIVHRIPNECLIYQLKSPATSEKFSFEVKRGAYQRPITFIACL